ncbi:MAG: riboflavin kinase [Candidatus Pacebacteria bacterium]|nr:riboflavin kinase [Candidatus Paceibacterota bacterium]
MKFVSRTIKGHGRGKALGYPTINMIVPETIPVTLMKGVYAVRVKLQGEKYLGALYYGPVPVFAESRDVFEVNLLDVYGIFVRDGEEIEVEIVKYVRGVMDFGSPELLKIQMDKDVAQVKKVLTIKI